MDLKPFANDYIKKLSLHLLSLDLDSLEKAADLIWDTYQNQGNIYFIGNGGSASTASHMANDFGKGLLGHKGDAPWPPFKAISLTDNVSVITAWANDTGYDQIFSEPLKGLIQRDDLLIAISASGNSPNVINAIKVAKEIGAKTLGLAGFEGGKLKEQSDVCIWIQESHYGRVEDLHMIFDHLITDFLYHKLQEEYQKPSDQPATQAFPQSPQISQSPDASDGVTKPTPTTPVDKSSPPSTPFPHTIKPLPDSPTPPSPQSPQSNPTLPPL